MKVRKWLIINKNGTARLRNNSARLNTDEVAIKLEVEIPDEMFMKPHLEANIKIPLEACSVPNIKAEVAENITEAVKAATGMEMSIKIIEPDIETEPKPDYEGL